VSTGELSAAARGACAAALDACRSLPGRSHQTWWGGGASAAIRPHAGGALHRTQRACHTSAAPDSAAARASADASRDRWSQGGSPSAAPALPDPLRLKWPQGLHRPSGTELAGALAEASDARAAWHAHREVAMEAQRESARQLGLGHEPRRQLGLGHKPRSAAVPVQPGHAMRMGKRLGAIAATTTAPMHADHAPHVQYDRRNDVRCRTINYEPALSLAGWQALADGSISQWLSHFRAKISSATELTPATASNATNALRVLRFDLGGRSAIAELDAQDLTSLAQSLLRACAALQRAPSTLSFADHAAFIAEVTIVAAHPLPLGLQVCAGTLSPQPHALVRSLARSLMRSRARSRALWETLGSCATRQG
jgi:hypothetical protein